MNEMDKKMEEFFQKSMEDFNDAPSDIVWDQLSDQLDNEETVFTKVWKRVRTVLPIALLLLSFGALSLGSYTTIRALKNNNNLLQSENIGLNEKHAILLNTNQALKNKNETLITDFDRQKEQLLEIQEKIKKSQGAMNYSFDKDDNMMERLQLAEALNLSYESQLTACANGVTASNESLAMVQNEMALLRKENERLVMIGQGVDGQGIDKGPDGGLVGNSGDGGKESGSSQEPRVVMDIEEEEDRGGVGLKVKDLLTGEKVDEALSTVLDEKAELEKKVSELTEALAGKLNNASLKSWQYRYGFTGRAYNAFVPGGRNLHLSSSYGLRHELTFKEKWSLTHSIEFNEQEYSVKTDSGALPRSILEQYPDSPGAYADVRSVKSRATYFDTQLGIKYQKPSKKGNTIYFVNPSVVWQLYLPQEFNYELIQAQDLLVERRDYVGYLGSVNLQFGIERSLNEKTHFQMALFAEKSLVDLGFDNQNLTLVGLRSSILFGK